MNANVECECERMQCECVNVKMIHMRWIYAGMNEKVDDAVNPGSESDDSSLGILQLPAGSE